MSDEKNRKVLRELLREHGQTYAAEAGIRLRDTPQPLYRTLVLAHLLSARIRASVAVATSRTLYEAGLRDASSMSGSTWQQRVDALGEGGYRRYDERTATQLGDAADLLLDRWGGDLRKMREQADGDADELRALLQELPGIGAVGAAIFLREVQDVWPEFGPYVDAKAMQGAERLGLPRKTVELRRLAEGTGAADAELASALVRAALDKGIVEELQPGPT
ncbi:HhH-GDP family DNA glycosylase [Streptomyces cavernicola]|uniref:Endonuclease n=1 Tax=Streptomyces cavernicola TaxID=3043613 RepID=A0ABT6SBI1_9ACTN|nr:endonuclease [Streptomyces sp. B-S-A6]MDI3405269.1 endonuclease [Streptomyces sp. B-S-A6]